MSFASFLIGLGIGAGAMWAGHTAVLNAIAKIKSDFSLIHERISKVEVIAQDAAKKATDVANQATAQVKSETK